jgi:hypothetical protein
MTAVKTKAETWGELDEEETKGQGRALSYFCRQNSVDFDAKRKTQSSLKAEICDASLEEHESDCHQRCCTSSWCFEFNEQTPCSSLIPTAEAFTKGLLRLDVGPYRLEAVAQVASPTKDKRPRIRSKLDC